MSASQFSAGQAFPLPHRGPQTRGPFKCEVRIFKEDDGYFSVAADLPGAVSQGETVEEAVENIQEALEGLLGAYLSSDTGSIPWARVPLDEEAELVHTTSLVIRV